MEETARIQLGSTHYVWEPPARDISILLNLELVNRLQAMIRESPEQETGGVLLGRCDRFQGTSERRIVVVEDIEPVSSEHLRGPAFALSQQDSRRLERTLARARENNGNVPVGFFRSHLRKGIYLDEADFSLFQAYFSSPCDVFLVARPQEGEIPLAGFFYWQDETFERRTSYVQFPLDRGRLETGGYQLGPRESSRTESPVTTPPDVAQVPQVLPAYEAPKSLRVKKAVYAALGTGLILSAVVCAMMLRSGGNEVSLSVERDGAYLKLSWDPGAPTIAHANSAVLLISDGGKQGRLQLNADQLKTGNLMYTPNTADVNFRLDLLKVSVQGTESVHYVADKQLASNAVPAGGIAAAPKSAPPAVTAPPVPTPAPHEPPARARRHSDDDDDQQDADRAAPAQQAGHAGLNTRANQAASLTPALQTPPQQIAKAAPPSIPDQQPQPSPPPPQTTPQGSQIAPVAQQPPTRPHAEPTVNIATQAVPPHRLQDWLGKVPIARKLRNRSRENEAFVPPKPSHQITPHLPARLARVLPGDWRVDLKLSVDSQGRVNDVELMSPGSDDRLADISADAMRQWRFEPARIHDKPVRCEVLATLHFRNPMPDGSLAQRE